MPKKRTFRLKRRRFSVPYQEELNPQQLDVVMHPGGPMLVVAGAGSGKTRAITYRVARLIESGTPPQRILLLTFTNRAAREMMHRVELLLGEGARGVWGGTFHHFANRLLRTYAPLLGYSCDYAILDREDARTLMSRALPPRKRDRRFPKRRLLCTIRSLAVNTMKPVEEVVAKRFPRFVGLDEEIASVLAAYDRARKEADSMDYDDLLLNLLFLLRENEDISARIRDRFDHVLVDEYQDTNAIQGETVDIVARDHRNVCVVGDDAQAIYGWRGASFENIYTFPERYPECTVFRLETNYRSTPEILLFANESISRNERRLEKTLVPVRPPGKKAAAVPCQDESQQTSFVADYILYLCDEEGRSLDEIAVLYRSHWNALALQVELTRRGIPFDVRGGLRFFEQAHIKDATCFLRAASNRRDSLAWMRILPLFSGIGLTRALRILNALAAGEEDEVFLPANARRSWKELKDTVAHLRGMLSEPGEMLRFVLRGAYSDYILSRFANARARKEDIEQLARYADGYDSCLRFLSEASLLGSIEAETTPVGPEEEEHVVLSTVHQAKGLEWGVVFVIWLADGRFPTDMAGREEGGYEEERRVFHVAVTRAKDELFLTYPLTYRWRGMGTKLMKRSRFLEEVPEDVYEEMEIVED